MYHRGDINLIWSTHTLYGEGPGLYGDHILGESEVTLPGYDKGVS